MRTSALARTCSKKSIGIPVQRQENLVIHACWNNDFLILGEFEIKHY
jgi:hypothetical protein